MPRAKTKEVAPKTEFIVKREFKYSGKDYKRGDKFEPLGFAFDTQLIEQYCRVITHDGGK